ncbi:hypothetical protein BHE74_00017850 [Ensete ventricosum]|nr:hypothetical protein BHE74_00017850 [Ensete ventricosum]
MRSDMPQPVIYHPRQSTTHTSHQRVLLTSTHLSPTLAYNSCSSDLSVEPPSRSGPQQHMIIYARSSHQAAPGHPPNSKPTTSWRRTADGNLGLGFCRRAIDSSHKSTNSDSVATDNAHQLHFQQHHPFLHEGYRRDLSPIMPIRGVPVYHHPPAFHFGLRDRQHQPHPCDSMSPSRSTPRLLRRFPAKRSTRAPRMRWTTTLHARFVHAVELLGGHESEEMCTSGFSSHDSIASTD